MGASGNQGAGEFYEHQITRSLRVPGDADNGTGVAFLSRTQPSGAPADGTKETVSFWFKNGFLGKLMYRRCTGNNSWRWGVLGYSCASCFSCASNCYCCSCRFGSHDSDGFCCCCCCCC